MAKKFVRMPDGSVKSVEVPDDLAASIPSSTTLTQGELDSTARMGKPSLASEAGRVADMTVRGGLLGLPGLIGDFMLEGGRKYVMPAFTGHVAPEESPFEKPSDMLFKMTGGDLNVPETRGGRFVGNVGAATVGGMAGGGPLSLPRRAALGAGSGVGGEAGVALADDENNLAARLIGGFAGGALTGLPSIVRPNAEGLIRNSARGVTDADWRRAEEAQAVLNRNGISHLNSQLLGPNSSVDDLVNQASMDPTVRPQLLTATRNVVPETERAVRTWSDENLPINVSERRGMFADVQNIANQERTNLTNAANNAYTDAMPDLAAVYQPDYIKNLKTELMGLAKSDKYGPKSAGGAAILRFLNEKLPSTEAAPRVPFRRPGPQPTQKGMPIAHLNNLLKDLNTLSLEEGWKGLPVNDLKVILRKYTPEFDAAREARSKYIDEFRTPFDQGLAGQIRRVGGGPDSERYTAVQDTVKMVFPPNKPQPEAITRLAQDIGAEPVGWLLRDHLEQSLQAAGKSATNKVQAPANFVHAVAGNSAQRANLEAALFQIAKEHKVNPFAVRNGFYQLLNALNTFRDAKISPSISGSTTSFQAGTSPLGAAVAPQSRLARFFWERASTKTYQQIADLVTSKDGLAKLEAIARSPTPQARQALIGTILTQSAVNPPGLQPSNTSGETNNAP